MSLGIAIRCLPSDTASFFCNEIRTSESEWTNRIFMISKRKKRNLYVSPPYQKLFLTIFSSKFQFDRKLDRHFSKWFRKLWPFVFIGTWIVSERFTYIWVSLVSDIGKNTSILLYRKAKTPIHCTNLILWSISPKSKLTCNRAFTTYIDL